MSKIETPKGSSGVSRIENVSRRGFLQGLLSAGALVLAVRVLPTEALAALEGTAFQPNMWLGIETDGTVHIVAHRSEMGTGIRTSLPMVVADELEADWKRVKIEQAIGDKKYGDQNTDGSQSVRCFYDVAARGRRHGAPDARAGGGEEVGRAMRRSARRSLHEVVHTPSGEAGLWGIGERGRGAAGSAIPAADKSALKLKNKSQFRYIGKEIPIYDLKDLCTGGGKFGMDAKVRRHGLRLDRASAGTGREAEVV